MYVIIDIETTGGKFNEEGITEVAIYKFDGHEIVDQFISLVNPERPIQPFVVNLTGITPKMVKTAPKFHEIAKRIVEITENCVFIAHNTSFDYRIIRTEFSRLGYDYVRQTLCTVELSKQLIPEQPSYSLGKLCKSLGIPMNDRHRASGDALATVKLFKLLLDKDINKEIIKSTVKNLVDKEVVLPNKILDHIEQTPQKTGLFYIHDQEGSILYVGRGKNIQKGLNQLFLKTSKKIRTLLGKTHSISFEETGNDLIAELKFIESIGVHKPKYNSFRRKNIPTVVFNNDNMLLVNKGRHANEKSVILIEDNQIKGSAFIDLAHQIEHLEIVKTMISPLLDNLKTRHITKRYLEKGKIEKIVRY
ncbi:exonuclease domain-containing protein [Flavicella marina]|uniref:exonuclease domain-containing protein n=1 Tax=Flavicella marina TaxID=1475951 RepID=UPI00126590EB|nr:exonuclease domain-containing protein [Flavicella marina]